MPANCTTSSRSWNATSDLPEELAGDINTDLFPRGKFDKRYSGRYR